MDEIRKCSATIFSPTKMIYIAYVILLAMRIIPWHSFHVFVLLSLAFWVVEVFIAGRISGWLNK
jgi:hypothetical protein